MPDGYIFEKNNYPTVIFPKISSQRIGLPSSTPFAILIFNSTDTDTECEMEINGASIVGVHTLSLIHI